MLYDFIVAELKLREALDERRIRVLRTALEQQRDNVLAFARVLGEKLIAVAQCHAAPLYIVCAVCLLQRKPRTSAAYWQHWEQLQRQFSGALHRIVDAVVLAMKQTPRSSSMVENLNSRLRNYFFLRRQLGDSYLGLLQFFLNHSTFLRSQRPERVGKSPAELMTGQRHPHWLELLGFTRLQRT